MCERRYNKMSLCYDTEKWLMISLASVAISLSVGLVLQYAHGQNETRSLATCYSNAVVGFLFAGAFLPNFDITMLYDPEVKSMLKNYCNFYHEKTGIWLTLNDTPDKEVKRQFELKYNDSITHLRNKLIGVGR
jgi:hypothetical protein